MNQTQHVLRSPGNLLPVGALCFGPKPFLWPFEFATILYNATTTTHNVTCISFTIRRTHTTLGERTQIQQVEMSLILKFWKKERLLDL